MNKLTSTTIAVILSLAFGMFICSANAEEVCNSFDDEPIHFKLLYEKGMALGKEICDSSFQTDEPEAISEHYSEFASSVQQEVLQAFSDKSFNQQLVRLMQRFAEHADKGVDRGRLPIFEIIEDISNLDGNLFVRFSEWDEQVEIPINSEECTLQAEPQCKDMIISLEVAINQYLKPYNQLSGKQLSELAGKLEDEWGRYFEESRPQTLLDSMFTTYMEHDYISQNRLVGPMPRQWFVIHPSLVVENISNAEDGDELAPALAMEWIGINWWDKETSPIGYPIGISLSSVYSDRASAEDVGHGLMFHFNNSFSLGITDHDGDAGIYVTVDVLNLLAEKKQRINHYKDELNGIRESVNTAISKVKH